MRIAIIGTTAYQEKMTNHKKFLEDAGHEVILPVFDRLWNELEVCSSNRKMIETANEVHVIWDARSIGTIFDLGMCFALRKPIKLIYLNPKRFTNFVEQYAEDCE